MNATRLNAAICLALASVAVACGGERAGPAQVAQAPAPETVFVAQPPAPPQAPDPLGVSPRAITFAALGDTARLSVPDGGQCVAASDAIASVNEQGLVTAVANGDTHLRCWLGNQNASVRIHVAQALARVTVVAEEGLDIRRSGDSVRLGLARVDARGTPVEGFQPRWLSLAPNVVRVDSNTGIAVGVADSGVARIVGNVDGFADTVIVEVGGKTQASSLLSSAGRTSLARSRAAARAANQRALQQRTNPGAAPGGVTNQSLNATGAAGGPEQGQNPLGIGVRQAQGNDSIFQDPGTGVGRRPRFLIPFLAAQMAEYRLNDGVGGLGLEKNSGTMFGGGLDVTTRGLLSFRFQFMTGRQPSDSTTGSDRKISQGSFDAGLQISPWLSVTAGGMARRYETVSQTITVQRWLMLRAGGDATFNLGGGPLRGIARVFILPLISLASDQPGTITAPSFGIQSEFGLGFENNRISSSVVYNIERYNFPATSPRKEQFGALLFRVGYKFGW